jgi:hypothetical protein
MERRPKQSKVSSIIAQALSLNKPDKKLAGRQLSSLEIPGGALAPSYHGESKAPWTKSCLSGGGSFASSQGNLCDPYSSHP